MFDALIRVFRRIAYSAERDRLEEKFERIDDKFDHFDERLDHLELQASALADKLNSIHQITLANNEALEQKLNRSTVSSESVREIVDARIEGFQGSIKILQGLLEQIIRRDCGLS